MTDTTTEAVERLALSLAIANQPITAATLRALAQERDAAFQRGMLHACDIACDVMQRAAKCAREPDSIPNIRREFLAQARGIEDAIDAIRRASEGGTHA